MTQPHSASSVITRAGQCSQRVKPLAQDSEEIWESSSACLGWDTVHLFRHNHSALPPASQPKSPASSRVGLNSSSDILYIQKTYRKVLALNLDFLPSRMGLL